MSRSSPWPTSWRGSPGRGCSAGNRLTQKRYRGRVEVRSVGAKRRSCKRGLREGDDEMA
jgi:hypothetical protein